MSKERRDRDVEHRGGYGAGPKTVAELKPPPQNVTVKKSEPKDATKKRS